MLTPQENQSEDGTYTPDRMTDGEKQAINALGDAQTNLAFLKSIADLLDLYAQQAPAEERAIVCKIADMIRNGKILEFAKL